MDLQQLAPLLAPAILGIVGMAFLISGIVSRRKGQASINWPAVQGVINQSQVVSKVESHRDSDGHTSRRTVYNPLIQYSYNLGGTQFYGNRVRFGDVKGGLNASTALCNQYPVGSQVNVYYNPQKPQESILVPGTSGTLTSIIIGTLFVIIACGVGIVMVINLLK